MRKGSNKKRIELSLRMKVFHGMEFFLLAQLAQVEGPPKSSYLQLPNNLGLSDQTKTQWTPCLKGRTGLTLTPTVKGRTKARLTLCEALELKLMELKNSCLELLGIK